MTPWRKWLADFASTRVQVTYAVAFVWCLTLFGVFLLVRMAVAVVARAIALMTVASDALSLLQGILAVLQGVAAVLGAASAAFIAVVGAWFAGRWLQFNYDEKRNGKQGGG